MQSPMSTAACCSLPGTPPPSILSDPHYAQPQSRRGVDECRWTIYLRDNRLGCDIGTAIQMG